MGKWLLIYGEKSEITIQFLAETEQEAVIKAEKRIFEEWQFRQEKLPFTQEPKGKAILFQMVRKW